MLILTRRQGESIQIDSTKASATNGGEPVTVTVLGAKGNQVRVGIAAPADITILREELVQGQGVGLASPPRALVGWWWACAALIWWGLTLKKCGSGSTVCPYSGIITSTHVKTM